MLGEDIVSVAAGATVVVVVLSEPVVLVPLAQLTKAVVANKKAAQEIDVLKSLLVVFMLLVFCDVSIRFALAKPVPVFHYPVIMF